MPQPFDYSGAIGGLGDPNAAFSQGIIGAQQLQQNEQALAAQRAAAQAAAAERAQHQQYLQAALDDPSPTTLAKLALVAPKDHEAIKTGWGLLDKDTQDTALRDSSAVYGFARAGNVEGARKILNNHIVADKAAGHDTAIYENLLSMLDEPDGAKKVAFVTGTLLSAAVPDKFADTFKAIGSEARADELQPGIVDKTRAEADKAATEAAMAPEIIQGNLAAQQAEIARKAAQTAIEEAQLALGWERLGLDKDALMTTTQLKLRELQQSGTAVTGASLDEMTKAVGSSQQSQALAERANDLASQIETSGARGGFGSGWAEWLKTQTGNQDAVSALRTQYSRLTNSIAVKNLPPGSASDKDVAFALKGFPDAASPPAYIAQFLRGVAKLETLNALADDRKAAWISANGNLGTAKRDLQVGGVRVPAGTTFGEFNRTAVRTSKQGRPPERSYLDKYGR